MWLNASTGQLPAEDITRHFSIEAQNDVGGVITHVMNVRQVCKVGAELVPNVKFGRADSKAPTQQVALQRASELVQEVSKDSPFIHIVDTYAYNPVRTDSKFFSYGTLEILKLKWKPGYKWFLMQSLPEFNSQDKLWSGTSSVVDSASLQNTIFMVLEALPLEKKIALLAQRPVLPCHEWEFLFPNQTEPSTMTFLDLVVISLANECLRDARAGSATVYWRLLDVLKRKPVHARSIFVGVGMLFAIRLTAQFYKTVKQWPGLKKSLNGAVFETKQQKKVCAVEAVKLQVKLAGIQSALQMTFQHFNGLLNQRSTM